MIKKITYITTHYNINNQHGSLRSNSIVKALVKAGYIVNVICLLNNRVKNPKIKFKKEINNKVNVYFLKALQNKNSTKNFYYRVLFEFIVVIEFLLILKKIQTNLIICSYPPAFIPFFALLYSKINSKIFILELKDLMAGALKATSYTKSKKLLNLSEIYEKYLIKDSNFVSIVSPGMKNYVRKINKKIQILHSYNGVEDYCLNFKSFKKKNIKNDTHIKKILKTIKYKIGDKLIIYSGSLTQAYDLKTIILGFYKANLNNSKLLIIGEGEKKKYYFDLVRGTKIKNVFFFDFIPRKSILNLMTICSLGVHGFNKSKEWNYVLGNKIFDYMAMSLPILFASLKNSTTSKIINESRCGIVTTPGSINMFSQNLKCLLNKKNLKKYGDNGKKYVFKNFSRKKNVKIFINEFNKLINNTINI